MTLGCIGVFFEVHFHIIMLALTKQLRISLMILFIIANKLIHLSPEWRSNKYQHRL